MFLIHSPDSGEAAVETFSTPASLPGTESRAGNGAHTYRML